MTTILAGAPFSQEIRDATVNAHGSAQRSGFMADLFAGNVDINRYAAFAGQQYFIYEAIERGATRMECDRVARAFIHPELTRLPSVETDLRFLLGPDWRGSLAAAAATRRYVRAIERASSWSGGFVAHHYVRYLGDLSGGQHIARVIAAKLGLERDGVRAFAFEIKDPDLFKAAYRQSLDDADWHTGERERIVAEVLAAYRLATDVLSEL